MHRTVDFIARISRMFARAGGLLILACAVLVSLDVLFRNLFSLTVFESFELTGYAVAAATTFGFAWALVSRAHIRIEVLYNALPLKPRGLLDVLSLGTLAAIALSLAYWAGQVAWDSYATGARSSSTLAVPMAWPQGLWFLGVLWFAFCAATLFAVALFGVCSARFKDVEALFGVASIEDEIEMSVEAPPSADTGLSPASRAR
ncbi:MAG: TRAP transporter small permease subunit [Burkholderiaceae bacterium]